MRIKETIVLIAVFLMFFQAAVRANLSVVNTKNNQDTKVLKLEQIGKITGAATPVMDGVAGDPIGETGYNYIDSLIRLNEITPADPDNLAPNVIKYYNPNIDTNVHYYEIIFKIQK